MFDKKNHFRKSDIFFCFILKYLEKTIHCETKCFFYNKADVHRKIRRQFCVDLILQPQSLTEGVKKLVF